MTEIGICKDRFVTRDEPGGWGHNADWYSQSKEISRVNIDTTHGGIEVYIDGKPVAPRQNPKPKLWNVKVPKKWSGDDKHYWTKEQDGALTWSYLINKDYMIPAQQFTAAEIDNYGLQDCEKLEVTDDV